MGPRKSVTKPQQAHTKDASSSHAAVEATQFVESPEESSKRLRQGLASLFQQQSALVSNRRFRPAAPQLAVTTSFSSEQVWGQVSILYAPVLRALGENIAALAAGAVTEQATAAPARKTTKPVPDEDDDAFEASDRQSASSSLDDEIARLQRKLHGRGKNGKNGKNGKGGQDPDAWRYALGKPGDEDDEDMDDFQQEDGAADDAEADAPAMGDDFDEDAAAEDFGDVGAVVVGTDEGAEGVDDDAAALREMYGDDVSDDAALYDEDMEGFMRDREVEEAEEADENADGYDDEDGDGGDDDAQVASPFGPNAAPENPLDFTDIDNNPKLTAFQKEEQKRLRTIRDMEMQRVHGQHWSMQGEVAATARPRDSLIDTTLDFEHALRPVPVITEHFTTKLEDRIKKRIVDSHFDDVERKVVSTTPKDLESSKRDEALDAQKSKLSLMDLYEKEFLERQAAADSREGPQTAEPLTEIERDELKAVQMWKRLSQHLDALSNFYFTPKPVDAEVDARVRAVQSQAPAISLEAVGMSALAKDAVLAPQDLFRPKRGHRHTDAASTELLPQERQAIRRSAKANAKAAAGRKEKQQAAHKGKQDAAPGKKKATGSKTPSAPVRAA
jgi:U3 small nucleolar RNA-associated protein MPP10